MPSKTNKLTSVAPTKNDPKKGKSPVQNKFDTAGSSVKEAGLGCAILSAFENGERGTVTLRRISKNDLLRVIENIRHDRLPISKDHGHELIALDINTSSDNRIRVSLALSNGAANALLKFSRDSANGFSAILPAICGQVNNVAGKLLKLGGKDILIQSNMISANKHMANVVLKLDLIVFT
jgi:hypothetical protein